MDEICVQKAGRFLQMLQDSYGTEKYGNDVHSKDCSMIAL